MNSASFVGKNRRTGCVILYMYWIHSGRGSTSSSCKRFGVSGIWQFASFWNQAGLRRWMSRSWSPWHRSIRPHAWTVVQQGRVRIWYPIGYPLWWVHKDTGYPMWCPMVYAFKLRGIPLWFGDYVQTLLIARLDNGYQVHLIQHRFCPEICQPALLAVCCWDVHLIFIREIRIQALQILQMTFPNVVFEKHEEHNFVVGTFWLLSCKSQCGNALVPECWNFLSNQTW